MFDKKKSPQAPTNRAKSSLYLLVTRCRGWRGFGGLYSRKMRRPILHPTTASTMASTIVSGMPIKRSKANRVVPRNAPSSRPESKPIKQPSGPPLVGQGVSAAGSLAGFCCSPSLLSICNQCSSLSKDAHKTGGWPHPCRLEASATAPPAARRCQTGGLRHRLVLAQYSPDRSTHHQLLQHRSAHRGAPRAASSSHMAQQ